MKRVLRWIGVCLLALVVLIAVMFTAYRLRGPSSVQREAVTLLQKDYRPVRGVNAFPLLWFMRYDVPEDQLDAHMAADVEVVRKRVAAGEIVASQEPGAPPLGEPPINRADVCEIRAPDCLAKVAAKPAAVRTLVASHPATLARAQLFARSDYYWNEFPADYRAIVIAFPGDAQRLWLSSFALQFIDGDRTGALAAACSNLNGWRRMTRGTNSLIGGMLAISHGDGGIFLIADMLAGLRDGEAVPAECAVALQPIVAADVNRCAQMAGEFAVASTIIDQTIGANASKPWRSRAQDWLFFDESQSVAWRAEDFAAYCGEPAVARMLVDESARSEPLRPFTQRLECVSSLVGCFLADIAAPVYADYDARTLDFAAHLRLAATLLWLRDQPSGSLSERFDERPQSLRSSKHVSGVDEARSTLYVENFYSKRETRFELPFV
ncbi:MAG: hypothetical protein ABIO49_06655, partial [Dokdonella sp.]